MEPIQGVVQRGERAISHLSTSATPHREATRLVNQQSSAQGFPAREPGELEKTSDSEVPIFDIPSRSLEFRQETTTNQLVVSVIDDSTGERVRQIPSEVTLKIAKILQEYQGLLVDVAV